MFLKKAFLLSLIVALPALLCGQDLQKTGTTAAQFLKIDLGPRAIGMGGAFTANANDLSAVYWNPAGLAYGDGTGEAAFNHVEWFADVSVDQAAAKLNIPVIGTIAAHILAVDAISDLPVRTVDAPEGTGELFDANMMAIGLSYARMLTEKFAIGFNLKYIHEKIYNSNAQGVALDIGVLYRIEVLNELRLGASISNFGTKMRMSGRDSKEVISVGPGDGNLINADVELDSWDLPLQFRVGAASDIFMEGRSTVTMSLEAVHPNDHSEYVNSGIEYSFNNQAFIRAGYKALFELDGEQGLTFGGGLLYGVGGVKLRVDYAWQDFGVLNPVHHYSLGIVF